MNRLILAAALLVALHPAVALADSDGYFCAGKGYLAFETHPLGWGNSHVLQVVRVSRSAGIQRSAPIPLDEFQVHGMVCRDKAVELQGWTRRYLVDLSSAGQPTVTSFEATLDSAFARAQQNLGMLARPGVTDIPSDGEASEFQLVIAQTTRNTARMVDYYTISQIFQRDPRLPNDHILASETLFSGVQTKGGELDRPPNQRLQPTARGGILSAPPLNRIR